MTDRKILDKLVCPLTKTGLRYDSEAQELLSDRAKLAYPVKNGIPVLLIDSARQMDKDEVRK